MQESMRIMTLSSMIFFILPSSKVKSDIDMIFSFIEIIHVINVEFLIEVRSDGIIPV